MSWSVARRTGSIERDGRRGTYFILFRWVRFPNAEKPQRIRIYRMRGGAPIGRRLDRAQDTLEQIRDELKKKRPLYRVLLPYIQESAPSSTFGDYWKRFLEAKAEDYAVGELGKSRLSELEGFERRSYLTELWDRPIFEITTRVLEDWRRELLKRRSNRGGTLNRKTVWHIVKDVGGFLRWLHRYGDLEELPKIPEVKLGQRRKPAVPTPEALCRYLAAIPEAARGIFLIRAYNGLRMSEARALRVSDFDFERDVVTLRWVKASTGEADLPTMPVDYEVAEWVRKWINARDRWGPLFRNPSTGEQWTYSSERRVHVEACKEIETYYRMNHTGRHAFGTHAMARTGDPAKVQKAMRHASIVTTMGYVDREQLDIVQTLRPHPDPQRPASVPRGDSAGKKT